MPDLLVISAIAAILLLPFYASTIATLHRDILKGRYAPKRKAATASPLLPANDDDDDESRYFIGLGNIEGHFGEGRE